MKIAHIEALPGHKAFGFVKATQTHGGFDVHFPLHIVAGSHPGRTLLVVAGLSGLEIEPAMILPHVVDQLDPATLHGNLLLVPLFNTSGFEFEQVNAIWDDKDLNVLGRGDSQGSVSEQLLDLFYSTAVAAADAVIHIRTGALWGYFRYAGVYDRGLVDESQALAQALGLPHVLLGEPDDRSFAAQAARDGKTVVAAWIGGGPGLRDFRQQDMQRNRNAVLNGLRHLGILGGQPESIDSPVTTLRAHTVVRLTGPRGLTFIDKAKRGSALHAGEAIGYVKHPFTGDIVQEIIAPRDGVMLHAGASWPILPEDAVLAILGDPVL